MSVTDSQIAAGPLLAGPPKELLSSTTFLLKRLGFAAKDRSHDAFQGTGLSAFHFAVLALLEEDPRETQAVIADALGYDRSHIVRLLDELEERDLVVRKRDPEDRRRHVVKMTAEGKKALASPAPDRQRTRGLSSWRRWTPASGPPCTGCCSG